jgi:undecaprenyl-diphosphatase
MLAEVVRDMDEALLWFLRDHVPASLTGFFAIVTISGSAAFLLPTTGVAALLLLQRGRRRDAGLLSGALAGAIALTWSMKALVGRARPDLWEAQWYAGSSFPSGHTFNTAAFSTAAALCIARRWPRLTAPAMTLAVLWICLVALSRLVLGVHWPSDVLAAACLGASVALCIGRAFNRHH